MFQSAEKRHGTLALAQRGKEMYLCQTEPDREGLGGSEEIAMTQMDKTNS
jgi:hypothetical protein